MVTITLGVTWGQGVRQQQLDLVTGLSLSLEIVCCLF